MSDEKEIESQIEFSTFHMAFAALASLKSKDTTKVGAVLVGTDDEVLLSAFNGPPRGVKDLPSRFTAPDKYRFCVHAERRLINTAARHGLKTDGLTVYSTLHPCSQCAGSLVDAGIKRVVFSDTKTKMPKEEFIAAREIFCEAGVELVQFKQPNPDRIGIVLCEDPNLLGVVFGKKQKEQS